MQVTCISHTADPELLAASAARICYSSSTVAEFRQELEEHPEMVTRLIDSFSQCHEKMRGTKLNSYMVWFGNCKMHF